MSAILDTTLLKYVCPLCSSGLKPIGIFNNTWHWMPHNWPVIYLTVFTSNQSSTQASRSIFLFHNPLCDLQVQYSPYHQPTSLSQYSHILDFKQNAVEYIPIHHELTSPQSIRSSNSTSRLLSIFYSMIPDHRPPRISNPSDRFQSVRNIDHSRTYH
jgi:hypothetical protein